MNEFLRMMPVPNTFRHCTKDYAVHGTDFTIPKGTKIIIPIVSVKLSMFYIASEFFCNRAPYTMMRRSGRSRRFSSRNDGVQKRRETSLLWLSSLLVLDQGAGLPDINRYCSDTNHF